MQHFPIFTKLHNRLVVIVGAGEVAARKLSLVYDAGATIKVIAPQIHSNIRNLCQQDQSSSQRITIAERFYHSADLDNAFLVIAATNNDNVNQQVFRDADKQNLFVNVVDTPELCSFITPAIVDRAPLTIAISSSGAAPVLARLLRGKIESIIPAQYGRLAQLAKRFRDRVKSLLQTGTQRKNFWESVFSGPIAEHVFNGKEELAEKQLIQLLQQAEQSIDDSKVDSPYYQQGEVYLVGAGPGDPDLLTFKALRLMQQADVVIYDRLVSKEFLNLVRRDAERIYVGKQKADHCVPQRDINKLLVEFASQGKRVVRLKGGDPYIFGRGGEEAIQLAKAGVQFQVVPGITSAAGTSTYCGIPLTHRDHAQSVTFVTGHLKDNTINLNWKALAQEKSTLVIYMGLTGLAIIAKQLIRHGLNHNTPVAVIQNATLPNQQEVVGTLNDISQKVAEAKLQSPSIIVIGEVVSLRQTINQIPTQKTTIEKRVSGQSPLITDYSIKSSIISFSNNQTTLQHATAEQTTFEQSI
ncbi:MAG: uroporphyrinogen-III C-methyltransferase [Gammaproteobacteria bacterium]|nr:uroporphyrinogen-III C-methyltransferase [Gammaproteobacteria bacterium]